MRNAPGSQPTVEQIRGWIDIAQEDDAPADQRRAAVQQLQSLSQSASGELLTRLAREASTEITFWAARTGDTGLLRRLIAAGLDLGADAHRMGPLGAQAVHQAVARGQYDALEVLLQAGVDVHAKHFWDQTLLHSAAESGSVAITRFLISRGLALDVADSRGHTPVMLAAQTGHLDVVRELIRAGANVNPAPPPKEESVRAMLARSRQTSALIMAASGGHTDVVAELIKAGADLHLQDGQEHTAFDIAEDRRDQRMMDLLLSGGALTLKAQATRRLLAAASAGDVTGIRGALNAGADVNAMQKRFVVQTTTMVHPVESGGCSALMLASEHGHSDAIRALIAAGADLQLLSNTCVMPRRPAMHFAAINGSVTAIESLLDAGADIAAQQERSEGGPGGSALHVAAAAGQVETIALLIHRGIDPNERTCGRTSLHFAARHGQIAAADALLSAGAKINAKATDGSTPLIEASGEGQAEMVRFLLSKGADPNVVRKQFGGAIHAALVCSRHGEEQTDANGKRTVVYRGDAMGCVRELLAAGADVNLAASDGDTPLRSAAGQEEYVKLLLASGADVGLRRANGEDAIYWAVLRESAPVVRLLVAAGADVNGIYKEGRSLLDVAQSRKSHQIIPLLKAAGAKPSSELSEGQAAAKTIGKQRKEQSQRNEAQLRADLAIRPNFSKVASSKRFRQMIKRLEEISGSVAESREKFPGFACCSMTVKKAKDLQEKHREEFHRAGVYLFRCGRGLMDDDPDLLSILPTTDQFQVPAAMGTNGANYGKGVADIVEGLRKIHAECPFVITKVTFDTVEGRFTQPLKRPAALAEMMYAFCPDIVDQGTGTVEKLAKELKQTKRVFLWWD